MSFDGFLRTGELLNITWADVSYGFGGKSGVINLLHTKTGQKNAAYEALPILDPMVYSAWKHARASVPRGTSSEHFVYPWQPQRFRDRFRAALQALSVDKVGYRPYSLRRGGATAFYRRTANLPATVERGRWSSPRVARIYICDGLGLECELQVCSETERLIHQHALNLVAALKKPVEGYSGGTQH